MGVALSAVSPQCPARPVACCCFCETARASAGCTGSQAIERMVNEAKELRAEDERAVARIAARTALEGYLYQVQRAARDEPTCLQIPPLAKCSRRAHVHETSNACKEEGARSRRVLFAVGELSLAVCCNRRASRS
eukprot:3292249-Pleurochrysis_carterae.AAC.1